MEDGSLSSLLLFVGLVILHGFIVLAYAAVMNSPAPSSRERTDDTDARGDLITRLNDAAPRVTIATQLTLLLVRVAMIAIATVSVQTPLLSVPLAGQPLVTPPISYALVLIPLMLLVYLIADLLPTTLGKAHADRLAGVLARLLQVQLILLGPLVNVFMTIAGTLGQLTGGTAVTRTMTEEDIMSLMEGGNIESDEKEMIRSVLEFRDTLAREIMVPRLDMMTLPIDASLGEALDAFVNSGHSRIPIYGESIDDVKGLLYAKDLLTLLKTDDMHSRTITELIRPAYFVPETKRADRLFKDMQQSKIHLAIITDEYGGTAGLVTVEDLVEEIVGDIQDEYDLNEEADYIEQGVDEYLIDASMNLDDFNELLGVHIDDESNDTLAGFIISQLERIPEIGDVIETHDLVLQVRSVDGRRIRKVHVRRQPRPEITDDGADPPADADADPDEPPHPADANRSTNGVEASSSMMYPNGNDNGARRTSASAASDDRRLSASHLFSNGIDFL